MQDGDEVGLGLLLPQPLLFPPSHTPIASPSEVLRQFSRTYITISNSLYDHPPPFSNRQLEKLKAIRRKSSPEKRSPGQGHCQESAILCMITLLQVQRPNHKLIRIFQ